MIIQGLNLDGGFQLDPPAPSGPRKIGVGSNYANSFMGRAYIYNTDGTGEIILDKPAGVTEQFGTSIAMSDTKLVVGASATNSYSGKVYTYNLDGTGEQEITASDGGGSYHLFGYSVAVSDTKVVVGASGDNDAGSQSGSVYVYNTDGTGEVKITASDGTTNHSFGNAVAISDTKVLVGRAAQFGAAYIYNLDGTGEVKITSSDGDDNDKFGQSVAITDTKIIVGAMQEDKDPVTAYNSGSVYVYNLDGTGELKITPSDASIQGLFGSSVDATDTKIVVGSEGDNSYAGAVYVYNTDGTGELKITASDGAASDYFGRSVAIQGDKIIVGAGFDDSNTGAAYIYNLDGTGEQKITASDGVAGDRFGGSVAAS